MAWVTVDENVMAGGAAGTVAATNVFTDGRITPALGLFAGAGYNLATVGWNAGVHIRLSPEDKVCPYATGMYGYNAALRVTDRSGSYLGGTNYNGPSFGGGVEVRSRSWERHLHAGLLIPFRSEEAKAAFEYADSRPWPVMLTVGYHF